MPAAARRQRVARPATGLQLASHSSAEVQEVESLLHTVSAGGAGRASALRALRRHAQEKGLPSNDLRAGAQLVSSCTTKVHCLI